MITKIAGGLVVVFVIALNGAAFAAERQMTRDEYQATITAYTQRHERAMESVQSLNSQVSRLQTELNSLTGEVAALQRQLMSAIGSTEVEVQAFDRQLDLVSGRIESLMSLAPEVVIQRRAELQAIETHILELKRSKISTLPEMKAKLDRIDRSFGQLKARVAQPVIVTYNVVRGDNLWNIAKKDAIYADPLMWPRIYRQNREKIKDPDLIYPQQQLAIPFGVTEQQYLVNRGDFLQKIAVEVYNDPNKWHKIYQANKQQIAEPHLIFPAQVLDIPSN